MMKRLASILVGLVFGAVLSVIYGTLFSLVAQSAAGGYTSFFAESWLYISAFFVTLYSGTIGAILGECVVRGGLEAIVIDDTLKWGVIYAFILLPFTVPAAWLLIHRYIWLLQQLNLIQR